jgi:hypothetical protein
MPALPPYIPARDADLANWSNNFSTLLTASPGTYGLLSTDATTVSAVVAPWLTAYALAINPATKTPVTVAAKDTARFSMLATVRPYAQQISLNAGVLTSDKIAIGVNPRTSTPVPIAVPTTNPVLSIDEAGTLQHVLRFQDSMSSPSVKSKPYGVIQMYCYAMTSATPVTDPTTLPFIQACTKSPSLITWDSSAKGHTAYYASRWATRTGKLGPFSPIINYVVAG